MKATPNLAGHLKSQGGVVLVVALVLLIMITLFAIAAIRAATTELQITGNAQLRKEVAAAAQECIERQINSITLFRNLILGVGAGTTVTCAAQGGRYSVSLPAPVCKRAIPLPGSSLVHAGVTTTEITYWEVVATVRDTSSGAVMTTTQGFRMRMPLGSCPL